MSQFDLEPTTRKTYLPSYQMLYFNFELSKPSDSQPTNFQEALLIIKLSTTIIQENEQAISMLTKDRQVLHLKP